MTGEPRKITDNAFRYDSFDNGEVAFSKRKNRLPAMGWNSWNAFGSGNTEALTKVMAEKLVELGLDKLGYKYVVLDDGCYAPERKDGKLMPNPEKFPSGFNALGDYIHNLGLKFGMYNDIGTKLCSATEVGTYGHEAEDTQSYIDWNIDYLKVDNCFYMWDNATFSDPTNARYVFTPNVKSVRLEGDGGSVTFAASEGNITADRAFLKTSEGGDTYATFIGTYDGTATGTTPVGTRSSELTFPVTLPAGEYNLFVEYATGREEGVGEWLQVAVDTYAVVEEDFVGTLRDENETAVTRQLTGTGYFYDDFLPATDTTESFTMSSPIRVVLGEGENILRIMNHRRQENTLSSYAEIQKGFYEKAPDRDLVFSICEWGKTQPQNWGYKVGDSWRILNDITFAVGSDGDPGTAHWHDPYTNAVCSQFDKAVVMDGFAGLDKGWNDPDMLVIGMNEMTPAMNRSHMAMWCMLNSPLMLGLDLRRVEKGDELYEIIANERLIALNQDALGVQAKRVFTTIPTDNPDLDYITNDDRVDILVKPLADGSLAIGFFNLSKEKKSEGYSLSVDDVPFVSFARGDSYTVTDLFTGEESTVTDGVFSVDSLDACDCHVIRVKGRV